MGVPLFIALALPFLNASSQETWRGPAFLDALDTVTVWLPKPQPDGFLAGVQSHVTVDGSPVAVARVEPGALAEGQDGSVYFPGTFAAALGGRNWDPAESHVRATYVRDDVYELIVPLPKGRYEYKVARGGTWALNYGTGFESGGANLSLGVPRDQPVRFVVDFAARTIRNSVEHPTEVPKPTTVPPRPPDVPQTERSLYQTFRVRLKSPLKPAQISVPIHVRLRGGPERPVIARGALDDPAFRYETNDLGPAWSRDRTVFKVWSPVAARGEIVFFATATGPETRRLPLRRGAKGVWFATVPGNLDGVFYRYEFESYGQRRVVADVYARAASADSSRSMVLDLARTNPPRWPAPRPFLGRPTDAVVYEAHIRDLTIDPSSGVPNALRGKYLGVAHGGSRVPASEFPTGLDHLKRLGVTHLHLLPFQDFNPAHSMNYNWGYETTLFNVPEEQYATNPTDPIARIREVKRMVSGLQRAGIGVVLDVVYNHSVPSQGEGSAFWETVPYYWFRTNDRGDVLNESGVGNALHDGRFMVRKFVRESLRYWAREFRLDGFRFDLLGMFTKETVADLAKAIRAENPSALVYGEPWTGGGPLRFGKGDQQGLGVAVFNDGFRNLVRGDLDGTAPGFAMGGPVDRAALERALSGSIADFAATPAESVNYVSAHDNLSFWDRVARSLPEAGRATRAGAVVLAHAMVLLSPGIPFIEGGVEIGRTKGSNHNSYNAGDPANRFDWRRGLEYADVRDRFKALIALRKAHPAFRLPTAESVRATQTFLPGQALPPNSVAYRLRGDRVGDPWREILVVFHGGIRPASLNLPGGPWKRWRDGVPNRPIPVDGVAILEPLSANVFFRT
ncbi:MAG: type I pullulanase [Fimbriimonadaceae bacterium]|nr:type I pullulanase [Fimbriimonadaceae bacterium]